MWSVMLRVIYLKYFDVCFWFSLEMKFNLLWRQIYCHSMNIDSAQSITHPFIRVKPPT